MPEDEDVSNLTANVTICLGLVGFFVSSLFNNRGILSPPPNIGPQSCMNLFVEIDKTLLPVPLILVYGSNFITLFLTSVSNAP